MKILLLGIFSLISSDAALAGPGDAVWNATPASNDWNTPANWTPTTVPSGTATFETSSITAVSVSKANTLSALAFDAGADAFAFTITPGGALNITGAGITNNSGITQSFLMETTSDGTHGGIFMTENGTVGPGLSFHLQSAQGYILNFGAYATFGDSASAGNGVYQSDGGTGKNTFGGVVTFYDDSSAGDAMIVNNSGRHNGNGAYTVFNDYSAAGNATITCNGSTTGGGGFVLFTGYSSPGNATIIAKGGQPDRGGVISFNSQTESTPNTCRIVLRGNGLLQAGSAHKAGTEVGSIEGDGLIQLFHFPLTVGRNNRNTTFSGVITGTRKKTAITKIGTGTLNLTGANAYSGTTLVSGGELAVNNTSGSATGTGEVDIERGATLSGGGTVAGSAVVASNDSGEGTATLWPSKGTQSAVTLTIQGGLTLKLQSLYTCQLDPNLPRADQVSAAGMTIKSGATFSFSSLSGPVLPPGTTFVVLNNTGSNPISGTFSNLPDHSTFSANGNTFQVSYEGGDGNDLTLTVAP